jgi:hypothetical protein
MNISYFRHRRASQSIPRKCGFDRENRDRHGCEAISDSFTEACEFVVGAFTSEAEAKKRKRGLS